MYRELYLARFKNNGQVKVGCMSGEPPAIFAHGLESVPFVRVNTRSSKAMVISFVCPTYRGSTPQLDLHEVRGPQESRTRA